MKSFFASACVVCLSASVAWAVNSYRNANVILQEYDDIKLPALDSAKRKDSAYVRKYNQDRAEAVEKQNALAVELYRSHPDHPRAVPLMATRLTGLMNSKDTAKAITEIEAFVKAHPKEEQGANLLSLVAARSSDKAKRLSIYCRIVANYPGTRAAKSAQGSIRQIEGIGKPFELSFNDAITNKPVSIKRLHGKVVVIDFWATWCGPCVAEMPKMKELYAQYKDHGVEFIGVSLDGPGEGLEKLKKFANDKSIAWPQYYQGKSWQSEFSQSWGIQAVPTVFVVDADGKLYSTEGRGKLDKLIPELIKRRDGYSKDPHLQTSTSRQPSL